MGNEVTAPQARSRKQRDAGLARAANRLEVAKALNEACAGDLAAEESRGRALDEKLTQTASFAGVVLALVGTIGGTAATSNQAALPWRISEGSMVVLASVLLLVGIVRSFVAIAPKRYLGIDESAMTARTLPSAIESEPASAVHKLAATKRDVFSAARTINDGKATAAVWSTSFVMAGMTCVVLALLLGTLENVT